MVAVLISYTGDVETSMSDSTAASWPLRVESAGAGKVGHRHRLTQFDGAGVGELVIDLNDLSVAVMLVRVGNAD